LEPTRRARVVGAGAYMVQPRVCKPVQCLCSTS